ncbi:MAG: hypothetical protein AAF557_23675 [Pseudomonadota bacterium]
MTDTIVRDPWDLIVSPFQPVHQKSFLLALIAAPLAVGLLGIVLVVPPFAIYFGYVPYLVLGTPVFWMVLKVTVTPAQRILGLMVAGFAVNFLSGPLYAWYFDAPLARYDFITMIGMVFAPVWAGTMGGLYSYWTRPPGMKKAPNYRATNTSQSLKGAQK